MEITGIERLGKPGNGETLKLTLAQDKSKVPYETYLYFPWNETTATGARLGDRITIEVWHEGSTTFESATEPVNAGTAVRGERSPVLGETMVDKLSAHVGRVQSRYDDARPSRIDLIPDTDGRG
jgi:hypothetical protein